MTSTSQDLPLQPKLSPKELPQEPTSPHVPKAAPPSPPIPTMPQPPGSDLDRTEKKPTSLNTGNQPKPLFSAEAFAAFSKSVLDQKMTQKQDDERHPRVYSRVNVVSTKQTMDKSDTQAGAIFCKDLAGFDFPGSRNTQPTSKDPQVPFYCFKGDRERQIRPSVPEPVDNKSEIPQGPRRQSPTPDTLPSQMEDLFLGTTDPVQVAKLFTDCHRAYQFYGVPPEEIPESPFFSREFQLALVSGFRLARDSAIILKALLARQEHYKHTANTMKHEGELVFGTRTIAFLGNSYEGKSSLINSLLDFPNLAATGDTGSAYTTLVTEYRQKDSGQVQRIKIEVEYLSERASQDHIKELLWSYRRKYLADNSSHSLSETEYRNYEKQSAQAFSTLEAAFGSEEGFDDEFLRDQSDGAFERISDQLIQWSKNIPWPEGSTDGTWTAYAETADDCFEKTRPFVRDRLWAFTRTIRIYIDSQILKGGLVLVDLPGLQDTNLARVKAAQVYLTRCDHIFLVANIARALTDQSLKTSLSSVISHSKSSSKENPSGKGSRIAMICTKSDVINVNAALRDLGGSESDFPVSRIKGLDSAIAQASDKVHKEKLEQMKEALCIEGRNKHVERGLKKSYEKVLDEDLQVFCVSSKFYEDSSHQQKSDSNPRLRARSGIPDLRKFCYFLSGDSRLREAKNFLRATFPSLIASISLHLKDEESITLKPPGPIKLDVSGIRRIRDLILSDLENAEKALDASFKNLILVYSDKHQAHWQKAAIEKGLEWVRWHWVKYGTCCLNSGRHIPAVGQCVDWNSELISHMRPDFDIQWDKLEDELREAFRGLCASVQQRFRFLKFHLGAHGFPSKMVQSVDLQLQEVNFGYENSQKDLTSGIRSIRAKTLESNEASFIVQEMIPAYRAAVECKGPDKAKAQSDIVQGRIEGGTLFPNIIRAVSNSMIDAYRTSFDEMAEITGDVFKRIERDVDSAMAQSEKENLERDGQQHGGPTSDVELRHKLGRLKLKHAMILKEIVKF